MQAWIVGNHQKSGFTIVELLIVVVVIAILAALVVVGYNGISYRAKETALMTDVRSGGTQLQVTMSETGSYPVDTSALQKADNTTFFYESSANSYCLSGISSELADVSYFVTEAGVLQAGFCPGQIVSDGDVMQEVTSANCPDTRTRLVDARDGNSYWVQQLADGTCWMLTNLAYAGGGDGTYGDTISTSTLTNATGAGNVSYTLARYHVHTNANPTSDPTNPSTSTDGGATNPQYGYLYNWCGAMGAQATAACSSSSTPAPNPAISVCPSGWRLPTGNVGGEFEALNTAENGGLTNTNAGLRSAWLAQYSGAGGGTFTGQGSGGQYWSSLQNGTVSAYGLNFTSTTVNASTYYTSKPNGLAVRCVTV